MWEGGTSIRRKIFKKFCKKGYAKYDKYTDLQTNFSEKNIYIKIST